MQKIDGLDPIQSHCMDMLANLIKEGAFQNSTIAGGKITITEGPIPQESVFDVFVTKRSGGYNMAIGSDGGTLILQYFVREEDVLLDAS